MKIRIKYRRTTITLDTAELGRIPAYCECCGKRKINLPYVTKGVKKLDFHHWIYAYTTEEVRKNPILVVENTSRLCFRCHMIADAIRKIFENDVKNVNKLLNIYFKVSDNFGTKD